MKRYLNNDNSKFLEQLNNKCYVDKTELIEILNHKVNTRNKYICLTEPRKFGKTYNISMLNAYYSKGCNSKEIFKDLNISNKDSYLKYMNKFNVIWIDMQDVYFRFKDNFIERLKEELFEELKENFSNLMKDYDDSIQDIIIRVYERTGERFVFLIDNWDILARVEPTNLDLYDKYIEFLTSIFVGCDFTCAIDLAFMSGVFQIKLYSMLKVRLEIFDQYSMIHPYKFKDFIGFNEDEVKKLLIDTNINFEELSNKCGGYILKDTNIFNPNTVINILNNKDDNDNLMGSKVLDLLKNHKDLEIKENLLKILNREKVKITVRLFENDLSKIKSLDQALTILIYLGYLGHNENDETCYIPNEYAKDNLKRIFDL